MTCGDILIVGAYLSRSSRVEVIPGMAKFRAVHWGTIRIVLEPMLFRSQFWDYLFGECRSRLAHVRVICLTVCGITDESVYTIMQQSTNCWNNKTQLRAPRQGNAGQSVSQEARRPGYLGQSDEPIFQSERCDLVLSPSRTKKKQGRNCMNHKVLQK